MEENIPRFMSVQEIGRIFSPREIYRPVTANLKIGSKLRVSPAATVVPKGALGKRSSVTAPICLASQLSFIQTVTQRLSS